MSAQRTKLTKEMLVRAAEELNEVLGLDPEINTKGDISELTEGLLDAATLIEPEDELSEETMRTIELVTQLAEEEPETEEEPEVEEEPEAEEEPEVEEEPETKEEPAQASNTSPKEVEKRKSSAPPKKKMTRPEALAAALKELKGKVVSAQDIIELASRKYEEANGVKDKDHKGSRAEWDVVNRVLVAVGVLEKLSSKQFRYIGPS